MRMLQQGGGGMGTRQNARGETILADKYASRSVDTPIELMRQWRDGSYFVLGPVEGESAS